MSYTSAKSRPSYTFDALLEFKDAGLIAADGLAQVDGANKTVDVGAGLFEADMVVDVTALEVASGDERYEMMVQGSNSPTFASGIAQLATFVVGDATVTGGDADDGTGRYVFGFSNRGKDETLYRYLRLNFDVGGTIATGINLTAFAARRV
jgi:hypothetical protein